MERINCTSKSTEKTNRIPTTISQRLNPTRLQQDRLQNVLLIYADSSLHEENEEDFQETLAQLRSKINEVVLFNDADACVQFLKQLDTERAIVIISGSLGKILLSRIAPLPQVYFVYLIGENLIVDEQWTKVKSVFTNIEPLYESLAMDVKQCNENDVPITYASTDESHSGSNNNQLEASFMYTQLFKKILLEMKHDEKSLKDLVRYYQRIKAGNEPLLKRIDEFGRDYRPNEAIRWYSRETFVYEIVNSALRSLDGDTIIHMGFFIRDLHYQIQQLHEKQISERNSQFPYLYRGQGMSMIHFEKLQKNKGHLMSFNCFLSTSADRDYSLALAESNAMRDHMVGILFVIKIDPNINSTPFAKVVEQSHFPEEAEYLFSTHSVFRTGDIKCLDEHPRLFEVQLTLTADDDPELRQLTDHLAEEFSDCTEDERLRRLLMRIGQDNKAEKLYRDLLDQPIPINKKVNCYHRLGLIKEHQGNYTEALQYHKEALVIQREILPDDDFQSGYLYDSIGSVYNHIGDYSNALVYYEAALDIYKKCRPADHLDFAHCYSNIGMTYHQMGKYPEALASFRQTLDIVKKVLPANHRSLASTYLNIGVVCSKMKDYSNALSNEEKALDILERTLPDNHPSLANAHNNIGLSYDDKGDHQNALLHLQQALSIYMQNPDFNHPLLAVTYVNLGHLYSDRYDYPEALSNFEKALCIFKKILQQDHSSFAAVYNSIGAIFFKMQEYSETLPYYEQVVDIFKRTLPGDHPDLATGYNNLGVVYYEMERYQEALPCMKQALDIRKKILPDNDPSLAAMYTNIGFVYDNMKDYETSVLYLQKALAIQRNSSLPPDPTLRILLDQIEAYKRTL